MIKKLVIVLGILAILLFIFGSVIKEETRYLSYQWTGVRYSLEANPEFPEPGIRAIIPLNKEFGIVIPKINANVPIFYNVDPHNPAEYLPVLKRGLAQTKGSAFPDEKGSLFIFAQANDNFYSLMHTNPKFFLLDKLDMGDEIDIFYFKKRYKYQISYKMILSPEEAESYIGSLQNRDVLVLETYYPPLMPTQRLLVIAKKTD